MRHVGLSDLEVQNNPIKVPICSLFTFSKLAACNLTIIKTLSQAFFRQFSESFQNVYKTPLSSPLTCLNLKLVDVLIKKYLT